MPFKLLLFFIVLIPVPILWYALVDNADFHVHIKPALSISAKTDSDSKEFESIFLIGDDSACNSKIPEAELQWPVRLLQHLNSSPGEELSDLGFQQDKKKQFRLKSFCYTGLNISDAISLQKALPDHATIFFSLKKEAFLPPSQVQKYQQLIQNYQKIPISILQPSPLPIWEEKETKRFLQTIQNSTTEKKQTVIWMDSACNQTDALKTEEIFPITFSYRNFLPKDFCNLTLYQSGVLNFQNSLFHEQISRFLLNFLIEKKISGFQDQKLADLYDLESFYLETRDRLDFLLDFLKKQNPLTVSEETLFYTLEKARILFGVYAEDKDFSLIHDLEILLGYAWHSEAFLVHQSGIMFEYPDLFDPDFLKLLQILSHSQTNKPLHDLGIELAQKYHQEFQPLGFSPFPKPYPLELCNPVIQKAELSLSTSSISRSWEQIFSLSIDQILFEDLTKSCSFYQKE